VICSVKIFKGFISVDYLKFFQLSKTGLRSLSYKLFKQQVRLDVRKYFLQCESLVPVTHINYKSNYPIIRKKSSLILKLSAILHCNNSSGIPTGMPEELLQCKTADNFNIKLDFFREKNGD